MGDSDFRAAVAAWLDDATLVVGADAVDASLRAMPLAAIVELAAALRAGRSALHWKLGDLDRTAALRRFDRAPRLGLAGLLSLHRDGYIRQAGLDALCLESDALALPFFVLRLDDIVPALRERARVAIDDRLSAGSAAAWVQLLPLVGRLARRTRAGASATLRGIEAFLVSDAARAPLLAATRSPDVEVRRAATVLAVRRGAGSAWVLDLLEAAVRDSDAKLVRWAAVEVTSSRAPEALRRTMAPRLLVHRDPAVRRRAVLALARDGQAAELQRALFDPRAAIRLLVREKLGAPGAHALYGRALGAPETPRRDLLGALGGLAEVGTAADAALAVPHLASVDPRVRGEAIRCLGMLDAARYRAEIEAAAQSPLRRVRAEAERILARLDGSLK